MAESQLNQLEKKLAALEAKVEVAEKKWLDTTDPQKSAVLKGIYDKLFEEAKERRHFLASLRANLAVMLPMAGGRERPESMEVVRDAIRSLRPDWPEMADLFTDEDLRNVLAGGYSDLRTLRNATAQMLHTTGLRPARIDNITQSEPELDTSQFHPSDACGMT